MSDETRDLIPIPKPSGELLPMVQPPELATEQEQNEYKASMIALARRIQNNRDLRRILKATDAKFRFAVYEGVKPYLTFKPLSYTLAKP